MTTETTLGLESMQGLNAHIRSIEEGFEQIKGDLLEFDSKGFLGSDNKTALLPLRPEWRRLQQVRGFPLPRV